MSYSLQNCRQLAGVDHAMSCSLQCHHLIESGGRIIDRDQMEAFRDHSYARSLGANDSLEIAFTTNIAVVLIV
jgi:hypothetical protein